MALKGQSIRNGVQITLNGKEAEKQEVIEMSKDWTPNQETLFKKTLQQGGEIIIKGVLVKITVQEKIVTSAGVKDTGIIVAPGADARF
jgi:hypothetical protein